MKKKIQEILTRLKEEFPGHEPKMHKGDPLDLLTATILSQNTNDNLSYRAFRNLKREFKNWDEVLDAPLLKVRKAIRICGIETSKAKAIRNVLSGLRKKRGRMTMKYLKRMDIDEVYEELLSYKGVGYKTASCVLAFSLGKDVFPVDTHVHRIANRLGLADAKHPEQTFQQLKDKIPEGEKLHLHLLLIKFGRKICRSQKPLCNICPLYDLCCFKDKRYYAELNAGENLKPVSSNFIILEHV